MHSKGKGGATPEALLFSEVAENDDNMDLLIQALFALYPEQGNKDDFIEVVTLDSPLDLAFRGHFLTLIRAVPLVFWVKKPDCRLRRTEKTGSGISKCGSLSLETLPRSLCHVTGSNLSFAFPQAPEFKIK